VSLHNWTSYSFFSIFCHQQHQSDVSPFIAGTGQCCKRDKDGMGSCLTCTDFTEKKHVGKMGKIFLARPVVIKQGVMALN